ncbi:glycosyltransferase family 2 protein [Lachnoclostridium sp. Marseille-P6806]|uniref:glycosyltransferase family 2 protein n=1 Tax=Lachnoclostridium sp. Marseille-P6806 TaxID=2364793 RepID=UPI001031ECD6|nr:glycosyltransferase family 2 protein [Lachnoclostridium sp. Marseille-P6806]
MPKLSICIPAYENPEGIKRLLESVFSQRYTDFELIVTDDSGSDAVERAVREAARRSGRCGEGPGSVLLRYFRNTPGLGAVRNWNRALSLAQGEYVKLMHHDDWFSDEGSLGSLVELLESHPEADLAFCGTYQAFFASDGTLHRTPRGISAEDEALLRKDWRNLFLGNTIGAPSAVLVRRSAPSACRYDPELTWLVDEEYYLRLLQGNPHFACSPEPWVTIGLSGDQLTESVRDDETVNIRELLYIYRRYMPVSGAADVPERGRRFADYLLARLAANHLPEEELPADLGIPDAARRYRHALREERRAERKRRADTAVYLLTKPVKIAADRMNAVLQPLRALLRIPAESAFWTALTIELLLVIWDKSNATVPYPGQIFRVTFLLFLIKAASEKFTRRELVFFLSACVLGVISWRCAGRNELLRAAVLLAALRGEDHRRVMKYSFFVTLAGCLALAVLAAAGIFGDLYRVQDFDGTGTDLRYCFGMGNPNAAHCMLTMLLILGLYLWENRLRWQHYAALLVLHFVLWRLCRSAAAAGTAFLAIAMSMAFHYRKRLRARDAVYRVTGAVFAAGLVLLAAAAVWGTKIPLIHWLDGHVLTGRVASLWGTTFFSGTLATWYWFSDRANTSYFDLGWLRVVYWYGVIPMILLTQLVFEWLRQIRLRRDAAAYMLVSCLVLYTLIEAHVVSIYLGRNIALPLLASYLPGLLGEERTAPAAGRGG